MFGPENSTYLQYFSNQKEKQEQRQMQITRQEEENHAQIPKIKHKILPPKTKNIIIL